MLMIHKGLEVSYIENEDGYTLLSENESDMMSEEHLLDTLKSLKGKSVRLVYGDYTERLVTIDNCRIKKDKILIVAE